MSGRKARARDIVETSEFSKIEWGLRPSGASRARLKSVHERPVEQEDLDPFRVIEHYHDIVQPADQQTVGSCAACAFCQVKEWWIHHLFGIRVELDYDREYWEARAAFYPQNPTADEGLQLQQPVLLNMQNGYVPKNSVLVRPQGNDELMSALAEGPLTIGVSVHEGYRPSKLHEVSACVKVGCEVGLLPFTNGHAMALLGTNITDNEQCLVPRQSWGPCGLENSGLFILPLTHYMRWVLDDPVLWLPGPDAHKWRDWEKTVKREIA